jgi:hypothetical protein
MCDALASRCLVDEGQSEPSLQLDDAPRIGASYGHQIAAIDAPQTLALLLQQPFYGCVEVGFVQHGHEYTK